jgi:hypothetical protein
MMYKSPKESLTELGIILREKDEVMPRYVDGLRRSQFRVQGHWISASAESKKPQHVFVDSDGLLMTEALFLLEPLNEPWMTVCHYIIDHQTWWLKKH